MEDPLELAFLVVLSSLLFVGGCVVGDGIAATSFRQQAIKRGYAEYNQVTGQWQWKPNPEKPAEKEPPQ